jgi:hypothetical protein
MNYYYYYYYHHQATLERAHATYAVVAVGWDHKAGFVILSRWRVALIRTATLFTAANVDQLNSTSSISCCKVGISSGCTLSVVCMHMCNLRQFCDVLPHWVFHIRLLLQKACSSQLITPQQWWIKFESRATNYTSEYGVDRRSLFVCSAVFEFSYVINCVTK